MLRIHSWIISCPDGITPNSGLTGPRILYIYIYIYIYIYPYIQQLCEDTGCNPEDLPEAMNDREKWRERVRDIRAGGTTWWWWWWWYIYVCVCVCEYVWVCNFVLPLVRQPVCTCQRMFYKINNYNEKWSKINIYKYIFLFVYTCVRASMSLSRCVTNKHNKLMINESSNLHNEFLWLNLSKNKLIINRSIVSIPSDGLVCFFCLMAYQLFLGYLIPKPFS